MARPKSNAKNVFVSLRIPEVTDHLWEDTASSLGLNKTATVVMALHKLAKSEGIEERPAEAPRQKTEVAA
jgi:hypothetical protein